MGAGGVGHAVAGDEDGGAGHGAADPFGFHHVHDDYAALFTVFFERFFCEAFGGGLPLDVAVGDGEALLPAVVEDGGFDEGGGGGVGVRLRGDVEAALAGAVDHVEDVGEMAEAHGVDVDDVEACAGGGGVGDDFLHGVGAHGADVGVDGDFPAGGHLEDAEDFFAGGAGVVLVGDAEAEGALAEVGFHEGGEFGDLFGIVEGFIAGLHGDVAPGLDGVPGEGLGGEFGEGEGAGGTVGDGGAEVDERVVGAGFEVGGEAGDADFEFEGGGDAVVGLILVGLIGLAVGVEVDEAGGDDVAGGVEGGFAGEGCLRDGGDAAGADADVAGGVEFGGGVHDAAVGDDEVVGLGLEREGGEQEE